MIYLLGQKVRQIQGERDEAEKKLGW